MLRVLQNFVQFLQNLLQFQFLVRRGKKHFSLTTPKYKKLFSLVHTSIKLRLFSRTFIMKLHWNTPLGIKYFPWNHTIGSLFRQSTLICLVWPKQKTCLQYFQVPGKVLVLSSTLETIFFNQWWHLMIALSHVKPLKTICISLCTQICSPLSFVISMNNPSLLHKQMKIYSNH